MATKYQAKELQDWFIGKARNAAGYRKNIVNNDKRGADHTVIGKMYFFYYDPKYKRTLPIYDRFPLVFPIELYSDGFLGLNIHYLSVGERAALMGKLLEFRSNSANDETTRLKMSYSLLSSTKSLASEMRPCIKRYLFTQVRSRFIEITAPEWDKATQLPVEIFVRKG